MSTWRRHRAHRYSRASSIAAPGGEGWTIRNHRAILRSEPYARADLGAASDLTAKSNLSEAAPVSPAPAISPQRHSAVIASAHGDGISGNIGSGAKHVPGGVAGTVQCVLGRPSQITSRPDLHHLSALFGRREHALDGRWRQRHHRPALRRREPPLRRLLGTTRLRDIVNLTNLTYTLIISTSTGLGDPPGPGPTVTSAGLAISGSASFGSGARTYGSTGTTINVPPGSQNITVPFRHTGDNAGRVHFTVRADATNRYTVVCGGCGHFYFHASC